MQRFRPRHVAQRDDSAASPRPRGGARSLADLVRANDSQNTPRAPHTPRSDHGESRADQAASWKKEASVTPSARSTGAKGAAGRELFPEKGAKVDEKREARAGDAKAGDAVKDAKASRGAKAAEPKDARDEAKADKADAETTDTKTDEEKHGAKPTDKRDTESFDSSPTSTAPSSEQQPKPSTTSATTPTSHDALASSLARLSVKDAN